MSGVEEKEGKETNVEISDAQEDDVENDNDDVVDQDQEEDDDDDDEKEKDQNDQEEEDKDHDDVVDVQVAPEAVVEEGLKELFGASDDDEDAADLFGLSSNQDKKRKQKKKKQTKSSSKKTSKKSRKRGRNDDDDDDDEKSSSKRRSRRRAVSDDEDEREEEEEVAPPKELTLQDRLKKRRRPMSAADVESMVDEQKLDDAARDFVRDMMMASDRDIEANRSGQPALHKLKILSRVADMLGKPVMQRPLLDHMVLAVVEQWLKPLPDGSLPNVRIRSVLFQSLKTMPIQTEHLEECELGRAVMSWSRFREETTDNRYLAQELIHTWSRPIHGLSTNWRLISSGDGRDDNERGDYSRSPRRGSGSLRSSSSLSASASSSSSSSSPSRDAKEIAWAKVHEPHRARVPEKASLDYDIIPKSRVGTAATGSSSRNKAFRRRARKQQ
jgi:transcription factor SPN1